MRTFSKGRLARGIAFVLTATFLWSIGLTGFAAVPAGAQIVTRAATSQSVAVVPFLNHTPFRPETLGEEAAEAVGVELRDRLLLDVLPEADVSLQMRDLHMTPPLDEVQMIHVAAELDIRLVVAGDVRDLRIRSEDGGQFAVVLLAVRVFDSVAECNVNGAVVEARGPAMTDASEEELISIAFEQAAFEAVQQMKTRPTISAMVLWAKEELCFLNVGTRGGIRPGMKMAAIRNGQRLATVSITEADAIGAYGRVAAGTALRTGDQLRAIYEMPVGPGRPSAVDVAKKRAGLEKLLMGAAVLLGLGSFANRTRLIEEGGIAAPDFAVSNLANGAELGFSGFVGSNFGTLENLGSALVTWSGYAGTQSRQVVFYEIYRNDEIVDIVYLPELGENVYIDSPWAAGFRFVTFSVDPVTGSITEVQYDFEPWLPDDVDEETGEPSSPTWDEFVDDYDDDAGIVELGDGGGFQYGWFAAGPFPGGVIPGRDYYYRVRPVLLRQRRAAEGIFEWYLTRETEYSGFENFLVGVAPPIASSYHWVFSGYQDDVYEVWDILPNPEIAANLATFYFYAPTGADEVIVQVTRDPNITFDPDEGMYTQAVPATTAFDASVDVDLTQVPGTGDLFWWRLGARNRRSAVAPRPWPPTLENDYGYVWSERNSFSVASAARAALMHGRRDALLRARSAARTPARAGAERVFRAE